MGTFSNNFILYTEKYSSGDVCERCLWQSKRAIRSGSGRNLASECEKQISGTATGRRGAADSRNLHERTFSNNFIFLYGEVLKWSKRRDSKSRRALTRRVGSNPTFSAKSGQARTKSRKVYALCGFVIQ